MSLYAVQKAIYQMNREPTALQDYRTDASAFLDGFELTSEERTALASHDIGWLYVHGVNGQLLMHFAAAMGYDWAAYLDAMRQGLQRHGPVRSGHYATVGA